MNSKDFLNAARQAHGLDSDRKLARLLGVDRTILSGVRNGHRKLDPETCRRIADALDVPFAYVMACIQAERAKRPEIRAEWERAAAILKSAAACAVLGVALSGSPATSSSAAASTTGENNHYAHRRRRRTGFNRRRRDRRRPALEPSAIAIS